MPTALRWLMAPIWAAQILTGAKSFCDNRILGDERLNRRGLHVWRIRLANRMADMRRARLAERLDPADREEFARNGFIMKRNFLPEAQFRALVAEVENTKAPVREMKQGDAITRRIALEPELLKKMPATDKTVNGEAFQNLVRYVATYDAEPIVYIQTVFAQVDQSATDPQTSVHADTFHPTMKAWLFLHDVEEDLGPFVYVPGSHRPTKRRLAWERRMSVKASKLDRLSARGSFRVSAQDLKQMHLPPPQKFAVPANTLVVADTSGFHARGASLRPSTRVEIWAYARRNPYLPFAGLDPWALKPLKNRQAPLFWAALDRLEKLGLGKSPWRARGVMTASTPPSAAAKG
ncbi:phytanoyl-CoA dioxygenase family protein [Chelatococcus sambhunathii]|uniref:Phytanoyl-CoA dioxygenase family protein n=1 Tax=Chelatococcus sambhunathii TaxID=363953 RepID=A0ABU1DBV7_9HYPH|nr:phytanoyl-CoA dioxygenase family protein [Chelatococcus sambhunathii]MDR4305591.1 phytanoyl-CoA dioxygenase family protein [Chelatococcus sambhunathii]